MPYYRHDQPSPPNHPDGYQRHDAYPILDTAGNLLIISSRIRVNPTSDRFQQVPHYNVTIIRGGWVSGSETRDDTGYTQTFFGEGGKPYNGWVLFPTSIFRRGGNPASGSAFMPIAGTSWEQNGVPAPGECPPRLITNCLTTWTFYPRFPYGGVGGCPVKYMDSIVSVHGFEDTPNFLRRGHLEILYFTKIYGETRWEAWSPIEQGKATIPNGRLSGPTTMNYHGVELNLTDGRDWSAVTINSSPRLPPIVPVPDANLLQNWHFDNGSIAPWNRTGTINWTMLLSRAPLDVRHAKTPGAGVRYLSINTGGQRGGEVYQDIPVQRFRNGASYVFGATIRSESGVGTVEMELMQVDGNGNVLPGTASTNAVNVGENSPAHMHDGAIITAADSIPLSSQFFAKTTLVRIDPAAVSVRFALAPQTPNTFDITDTWVVSR
jgi:hypothetical protein